MEKKILLIFVILIILNTKMNYATTSSTFTVAVTLDLTGPAMILLNPQNDSINNNGTITFRYNVTDYEVDIKNCSLYYGLSTTNLEISNLSVLTENTTLTFITLALNNGLYVWKITCSDTVNNLGNSSTYHFRVLKPTPWEEEIYSGGGTGGGGGVGGKTIDTKCPPYYYMIAPGICYLNETLMELKEETIQIPKDVLMNLGRKIYPKSPTLGLTIFSSILCFSGFLIRDLILYLQLILFYKDKKYKEEIKKRIKKRKIKIIPWNPKK